MGVGVADVLGARIPVVALPTGGAAAGDSEEFTDALFAIPPLAGAD